MDSMEELLMMNLLGLSPKALRASSEQWVVAC
jgi:hypothetical protein